jgi:hypothetical protein
LFERDSWKQSSDEKILLSLVAEQGWVTAAEGSLFELGARENTTLTVHTRRPHSSDYCQQDLVTTAVALEVVDIFMFGAGRSATLRG